MANIETPIPREKFLVGWELETESVNDARYGDTFYRSTPASGTVPQELLDAKFNSIVGYTFGSISHSSASEILNCIALAEGSKLQEELNKYFSWDSVYVDTSVVVNARLGIGTVIWMAAGSPQDRNDPLLLNLIREVKEKVLSRWVVADTTKSYSLIPREVSEYLSTKGVTGYVMERDATVSGIEFHPQAPLNPDAAMEAHAKLLSAFESITVSARCSYHIHLSVSGMKHTYGINMQAFMYLYILNNLHRVPQGVLERWANSSSPDGDRYFRQCLGGSMNSSYEERYSFIAFRHEFSTWEFRCWGNVLSVEDAKACLDISIDAYNYAFDLVHKQKKMADLKAIDSFRNSLCEMANSYVMYG